MVSQNISGARRHDIGDLIPHIVQTACAFKSVVTFEVNDKSVNAKSIMGVMSMKLCPGMNFTVLTEGTDESAALDGMVDFFA